MIHLTDKDFRVGEFIVYENEVKYELGLVKSLHGTFVNVWFGIGGTAISTPLALIEPISMYEILKTRFTNEYAKGSLIERQLNLLDKRNDPDDLIDERHIRTGIRKMIEKHNVMLG